MLNLVFVGTTTGNGNGREVLMGNGGSFNGTVNMSQTNGEEARLTSGSFTSGTTFNLGEYMQLWSGPINGKSITININQSAPATTMDGLGSIRMSGAGDMIAGAINISNQAKIDTTNASGGTVASNIGGSGALTTGGWNAANTIVFSGSNTFAGGLTINAGVFKAGSAYAIPYGAGTATSPSTARWT